MSLSDNDLLKLMDVYADAHPDAEPVENFMELFDREALVKILQEANGREILVDAEYAPAQGLPPVKVSYSYR